MDRFEDLRVFVHVVDHGGITAAAERLSLAKSAVSRRLKELEGRLGVQLLRRTTRRLSLTDTGSAFYERAVRVLDDLDEAESSVSSAHGRLQGRLRVSVPVTFTLRHLGAVMNEFAMAHPDVMLDLDVSDRQVNLVEEGIDVAVRIGNLRDSSLIARHLAPVRVTTAASPAYLRARGVPDTPQALAEHACLVYSHVAEDDRWRYETADGERRSVKVRPVMRASNGDVLYQAAMAGLGITMAPTFLLSKAIVDGRLRQILPDTRWPLAGMYAVYPQTRHLSLRVRAFVDYLADAFSGEPGWDQQMRV